MKKEHQKIIDKFTEENFRLFEDLGNEKKDDLYKETSFVLNF
jgi:hypothetical protein